MESRLNEIRSNNGEVFGLSCDSPFSLAKWAEQEGYTFTLLSDYGKQVTRAYDNFFPELAGLPEVPKRSAFLVDKDGKLVKQEINDDSGAIPDLDAFIDELKKLG